MKFSPELLKGALVRRYKRFLADVLIGEELLTVHCPNTGAMTNCIVEGAPCWLSDSNNPKRKYRYTWELATTSTEHLAGVNTMRANALVKEAIENGTLKELQGYASLKTEVKYGENSRVDIVLERNRESCFVEVKSVTLGFDGGLGIFPDAKSARAAKHLDELIKVKEEGDRAVLLFCVQHTGISQVSPAEKIDPVYTQKLRQAVDAGVEVIAYQADISPQEICLNHSLPVYL
ncbi:DNA/RNA nuclease SfsA [Agarilytica rhodophyticola]|uniref:DNA/RNA nuclease SfsA n=1 Tax=Agarilytica rhodophyticola TaxID=1737490 RepID=UPI000B345710|nr:DNA/RNA nuclease SfsA [Agarilytica rhodophyticola]